MKGDYFPRSISVCHLMTMKYVLLLLPPHKFKQHSTLVLPTAGN